MKTGKYRKRCITFFIMFFISMCAIRTLSGFWMVGNNDLFTFLCSGSMMVVYNKPPPVKHPRVLKYFGTVLLHHIMIIALCIVVSIGEFGICGQASLYGTLQVVRELLRNICILFYGTNKDWKNSKISLLLNVGRPSQATKRDYGGHQKWYAS